MSKDYNKEIYLLYHKFRPKIQYGLNEQYKEYIDGLDRQSLEMEKALLQAKYEANHLWLNSVVIGLGIAIIFALINNFVGFLNHTVSVLVSKHFQNVDILAVGLLMIVLLIVGIVLLFIGLLIYRIASFKAKLMYVGYIEERKFKRE